MAKPPMGLMGLLGGKGSKDSAPPSVADDDDEEYDLRAELQALLDDEDLDDEELRDAVLSLCE